MTTTLVLGGARSGKSRHAVSLLRDRPGVTYIATRPAPGPGQDPDLEERISRHRRSRPQGWQTVETHDLTRALLGSRQAVLIDCLPQWVRAQVTANEAWGRPEHAHELLAGLLAELAVAARALPFDVVMVTEDSSCGCLPPEGQARLLADLVSEVNQTLAAACDQVHAVVAGRVLDLTTTPVVG